LTLKEYFQALQDAVAQAELSVVRTKEELARAEAELAAMCAGNASSPPPEPDSSDALD